MSCKGLSGRKLKKCMTSYVKKSKRQFPTFNQKTDTVSVNARSNATAGIALSLQRKPKGKGNKLTKDSSGQFKNYNHRLKN